jgi:hypothetical protein
MLNPTEFLAEVERRLRARVRQRPPSERDEEIYAAVQVQGQLQTEVAHKYDLSQGRISQICRNVEEFLDSHDVTTGSRQAWWTPRTQLVLSRQRVEAIFASAMRDAARCERGLATRRGGLEEPEAVVREVRAAPSLDTAMRALRLLSKIEASGLPAPLDPERREMSELIASWLEGLREIAVRQGMVAGEGTPAEDVARWLHQLLGPSPEPLAEVPLAIAGTANTIEGAWEASERPLATTADGLSDCQETPCGDEPVRKSSASEPADGENISENINRVPDQPARRPAPAVDDAATSATITGGACYPLAMPGYGVCPS